MQPTYILVSSLGQSDLQSKYFWTEVIGFYRPAFNVRLDQASHGRYPNFHLQVKVLLYVNEDFSVAQGRTNTCVHPVSEIF